MLLKNEITKRTWNTCDI